MTLAAAILAQSFFAFTARAASFPDVPSGSVYRPAIETLADRHVINGNPDGTFAPDRTVNRAEFLTLLYRAQSLTAPAPGTQCFKDVPVGSWFQAVVCDAAAQGFVSGYGDKTFRPEQAVNRVEALKMLFAVMKLNQQTSLDATNMALAYSDVNSSAWYMQYLSAAFKLHILPMPGAATSLFHPESPLSRAEAAAYIYNALFTDAPLTVDMSSASSVASSQEQSSAVAMESSSTHTRSSKSAASSEADVSVTQVDVPFNDDGTMVQKQSRSYRFALKQTTVMSIKVTVTGGSTPGDVSCRLYKLDAANSFSLEYYLGYEDKDSCTLIVALSAGSYQFDVLPHSVSLPFIVDATQMKGDGNDGFVQAKMLIINTPASTALDTNDFADFYKFTLTQQTTMTVELTNASNLRCVVYPMEDVDIYGFAGPECNQSYDFPPGTYYVGVLQKDGHNNKQNYSVRFHK